MPAKALGREAAALIGYVCVAVVFAWPLPLRMADALLGLPAGDAGVYVWNLWVFRHEIVHNHRLPFLTSEILALSQPVPLALHNYTTFANLLAFPLIPWLGVVKTFNLLVIGSGVMSGYAMYVYARLRTGDAAAAWIGGLLFGFSPFMSARAAEHFSLTLAAPLPLFGLLMFRLYANPSPALACAAGATVAWAFLCDAYFAVYCLLIAGFTASYSIFSVERQTPAVRRAWPGAVVTLAIVCVAGLIVGMILRGGGRMDLFGVRVSFTRLYTPVLILTLLVIVRVWMSIRPRVVAIVNVSTYAQSALVAGLVCVAVLSPVLSATGSPFAQRQWISPQVWWRNSAAGVDLLAFFAPNPLHPLFGSWTYDWFASMPAGFNENVASIPWVAMLTIVAGVLWSQFRPHKGWIAFTAVFACLALGPFVSIGKHLTYIPTPWTLLRYLPIVGAARMPTRLTILVMLGVSMLLVMAIQELRKRSGWPRLVAAGIAVLLMFELLPAPRTLHSAEVPGVYRIVAADPRPIRVLSLPFGLRDGLTSRGNYSASYQFYQTVHEKRLVGGYISRLPGDSIARYRGNPILRVLLRLSEGSSVEPSLLDEALERAPRTLERLQIGYVVVDSRSASPELQLFAMRAFQLSLVSSDGPLNLYRTPIAPPLER
jgi:hypothetical protein